MAAVFLPQVQCDLDNPVMDNPLVFGTVSFIAGWLTRDWSIKVPEIPPCKCLCDCHSTVSQLDSQFSSGNFILLGLAVVILIVIFSNTALALRVSYREGDSGPNRELLLGVKGKSKGGLGIYGASKGLQITD